MFLEILKFEGYQVGLKSDNFGPFFFFCLSNFDTIFLPELEDGNQVGNWQSRASWRKGQSSPRESIQLKGLYFSETPQTGAKQQLRITPLKSR